MAKAWSEARRSGQSAAMRQHKDRDRHAPSTKTGLPFTKERWEAGVCVYCTGRSGLKVGRLAISGNVRFCRNHAKQYADDKKWEAAYLREIS